jgi:hypothetical protein
VSGVDDLDTEHIDDRIAYHEHLEQLAHLMRDYTKVAHHQKMQQILRALKKHEEGNRTGDPV